MIAAVEKQKFCYVLNRDASSRLTISSPLEAHKSSTVTFDVVGVDNGYENPIFASLEVNYSDAASDPTGGKIAEVKKMVTYYEVSARCGGVCPFDRRYLIFFTMHMHTHMYAHSHTLKHNTLFINHSFAVGSWFEPCEQEMDRICSSPRQQARPSSRWWKWSFWCPRRVAQFDLLPQRGAEDACPGLSPQEDSQSR